MHSNRHNAKHDIDWCVFVHVKMILVVFWKGSPHCIVLRAVNLKEQLFVHTCCVGSSSLCFATCAKCFLQEAFDKIARKTRARFESNRPRAVLFEGPPGTGKTLSARVIAGRYTCMYIHVYVSFLSSFVQSCRIKCLSHCRMHIQISRGRKIECCIHQECKTRHSRTPTLYADHPP